MGVKRIWISIAICVLFVSNAFSIMANEKLITKADENKVIATITYRGSYSSSLQPVVVITQPPDGAILNDSHLIVLGYASYEFGLNYWEWKWEWEGGYTGNSSYFPTAEYVEFKIEIWGLHPGWNKITVTFCSPYGGCGSDSVNVTYVAPDTQPPVVIITYPPDGSTFTEPNIRVVGYATDNVGIMQFGYIHEWEGGGTGSSWYLELQPTYYPFEIPITLRDGWNRIKVEVSDVAGNYGKAEVIYTLNPLVRINLTIYDGLEGAGGGNEVPEDREESEGAFTVTNIQDTNGDGVRDKDQNPVIATYRGRDEVDLAKMVLWPPTGPGVQPNDDVTLVKSGPNKDAVKLWDTKVKHNEIRPTNPPDTWVFKVKDLPKTVWVEITEENPKNLKMRGITFTLSYSGARDIVCLTGIWSEVTDVKHDKSDKWDNTVWPDMQGNVRALINQAGGFGLRRYQNATGVWWHGNVIGIEFTVYPSGIGNVNRVCFDITRQIHYFDEEVYMGQPTKPDKEDWPNQVELPNDDTVNTDESDRPVNNHMYSVDRPGATEAGWPNNIAWWASMNNFMEFMRVTFNGTRPRGETVQGSRCSDYYLWHAALTLVRNLSNPGNLTRIEREKHGINCVGSGHLLSIDPKPPWK